ncbi:MAG: hypothetical protein ABSA02_03850 [Trebonia sp.]|jgi:hypothetical protein
MAKPWYSPLATFYFDLGFKIRESLIVPILLAGQLLQLVLYMTGKLPAPLEAKFHF